MVSVLLYNVSDLKTICIDTTNIFAIVEKINCCVNKMLKTKYSVFEHLFKLIVFLKKDPIVARVLTPNFLI